MGSWEPLWTQVELNPNAGSRRSWAGAHDFSSGVLLTYKTVILAEDGSVQWEDHIKNRELRVACSSMAVQYRFDCRYSREEHSITLDAPCLDTGLAVRSTEPSRCCVAKTTGRVAELEIELQAKTLALQNAEEQLLQLDHLFYSAQEMEQRLEDAQQRAASAEKRLQEKTAYVGSLQNSFEVMERELSRRAERLAAAEVRNQELEIALNYLRFQAANSENRKCTVEKKSKLSAALLQHRNGERHTLDTSAWQESEEGIGMDKFNHCVRNVAERRRLSSPLSTTASERSWSSKESDSARRAFATTLTSHAVEGMFRKRSLIVVRLEVARLSLALMRRFTYALQIWAWINTPALYVSVAPHVFQYGSFR
eukprot:TRINITY_DN56626_c0_g1_i1.p1 TRINITY_DN56626_c0_g1~~TRINITY_DN56626_c0_g1_i1.p1  ORF type:complete len:414 (+),score=41.30 TRINITY_DN56626_c0_g1_i1:144-1244(+)